MVSPAQENRLEVPEISVQPASPVVSERSPIDEVKPEIPTEAPSEVPTTEAPVVEVPSQPETPASVTEPSAPVPVEVSSPSTPPTAPMSPDSTTLPEAPVISAVEPESVPATVSSVEAEPTVEIPKPVEVTVAKAVEISPVESVPETQPEVSPLSVPEQVPALSETSDLPPPPPQDLEVGVAKDVVVNGGSPVAEIPLPLPTSDILDTVPPTMAEDAEKTEQTTQDELNVGEVGEGW